MKRISSRWGEQIQRAGGLRAGAVSIYELTLECLCENKRVIQAGFYNQNPLSKNSSAWRLIFAMNEGGTMERR